MVSITSHPPLYPNLSLVSIGLIDNLALSPHAVRDSSGGAGGCFNQAQRSAIFAKEIEMAQRVGFYSLRKTARAMCKFVYLFSPLIRAAYPNSGPLLILLETANQLCAEIVDEIDNIAPAGV